MTGNSLLDQLDAPKAVAWKPEEAGDLIAGKVIGVGEHDAGFGPYTILTIECDTIKGGTLHNGDTLPQPPATLALHCLGMVLSDQVAGTKVGDECAARYDGLVTSKNGNEYASWSYVAKTPSIADSLPEADAHADLFRS